MNTESSPHRSLVQLAGSLEQYIQQDPGGRGLAKWSVAGNLFPAALSLTGGKHVLLLTGYYILSAGTIETDGPPGTIILADVLRKCGKRVTIVTDTLAAAIMKAGLSSINCQAELVVFDRNQIINPDTVICDDTTHCLALERPGLAADNLHHNFRGANISPYIAPLDNIFLKSAAAGIVTIGIGDGGNELGMGNVSAAVDKYVMPDRAYSCHIPSALCISAGVSNWAGYALAALISLLAERPYMPGPPALSKLIDTIVKAGAVDGVTGKAEPTVDSLPRTWEDGVYGYAYDIAGSG